MSGREQVAVYLDRLWQSVDRAVARDGPPSMPPRPPQTTMPRQPVPPDDGTPMARRVIRR